MEPLSVPFWASAYFVVGLVVSYTQSRAAWVLENQTAYWDRCILVLVTWVFRVPETARLLRRVIDKIRAKNASRELLMSLLTKEEREEFLAKGTITIYRGKSVHVVHSGRARKVHFIEFSESQARDIFPRGGLPTLALDDSMMVSKTISTYQVMGFPVSDAAIFCLVFRDLHGLPEDDETAMKVAIIKGDPSLFVETAAKLSIVPIGEALGHYPDGMSQPIDLSNWQTNVDWGNWPL